MPENKRKFKFVLLMILSVFLLFTGCGRRAREIVPARETSGSSGTEEDVGEERTDKMDSNGKESEKTELPGNFTPEDRNLHSEKTVVVHVCGAVNSPGIYTLPAGSRRWEAVEAAGGVTENGAGDYLNMAVPVSDGEKVVVPFLADVEEPFGEAETLPFSVVENAAAGLINLNTADLEQLMTLPGIGESKARAILEYREKTGPFTVPEDITNVPGIKKGSYEKLKDYITV